MNITQFQESRKSARLPTQRSLEEDNVLGMLAVMMGYIDSNHPSFMDVISIDREKNILDRLVEREVIKIHQAKAIREAVAQITFKDSEKFGDVFCNLHGESKRSFINKAIKIQQMEAKKLKSRRFLGEIVLEIGGCTMNEVIATLQFQNDDRSESNKALLERISRLEAAYAPSQIQEFLSHTSTTTWAFLTASIIAIIALFYFLFLSD